jgi:hypothetical protein
MFSSAIKNANGSDKSADPSVIGVNKVAPGFGNGGSGWQRLTGQR